MFDTVSKHPPTDTVKRSETPVTPGTDGTPGGLRQAEIRHRERVAGYSHSMVPGGLLVMSSTTRLTSGTSLVIRVEMRSRTS